VILPQWKTIDGKVLGKKVIASIVKNEYLKLCCDLMSILRIENDMAIYRNTYEETKRTIEENWTSNGAKPNLFAHVRIRFGEKYMIDYTETYICSGIEVIDDLVH